MRISGLLRISMFSALGSLEVSFFDDHVSSSLVRIGWVGVMFFGFSLCFVNPTPLVIWYVLNAGSCTRLLHVVSAGLMRLFLLALSLRPPRVPHWLVRRSFTTHRMTAASEPMLPT